MDTLKGRRVKPDLIATCAKCGTQFAWDRAWGSLPDCPQCGYNAGTVPRAKHKECCEAASRGDLAKVKGLLSDPDVKQNINAGEWTILHRAVYGGHADVVSYVLQSGADPNRSYAHADHVTPLHNAVASGRISIVKLLLGSGADVERRNSNGETPADLAFESNDPEMLDVLLNSLAAEQASRIRHSMETTASAKQHLRNADDLFKAGDLAGAGKEVDEALRIDNANVSAHKRRADIHRSLGQSEQAMRSLVTALDVNPHARNIQEMVSEISVTLKNQAVEHLITSDRLLSVGKLARALQEVDRAVEVNELDLMAHDMIGVESYEQEQAREAEIGEINLLNGRAHGKKGIILLELEDFKAAISSLEKALHFSPKSSRRPPTFVTLEKVRHVTPDLKEARDALAKARKQIARQSAARAISEDKPTGESLVNAVHQAIEQGFPDIIQSLLDKGVNIDAKNKKGKSFLQHAVTKGRIDIMKLLVRRGANVNQTDRSNNRPIHHAIRMAREDVVRCLIENGADVNAEDSQRNTPLHLAVKEGREDVLRQLLAGGADADAVDDVGNTPLHLAVKEDWKDAIEILLSAKANVDAAGEAGKTPLHIAAADGRESLAGLLLAAGADIKAKDKEGNTALSLAWGAVARSLRRQLPFWERIRSYF